MNDLGRAAKPNRSAETYDLFNAWAPSDDFYLALVMDAGAVLDVGCGTGGLLHRARRDGHTGRLCGLDPAPAMLDQARRRTDIEWVLSDAASARFDREFDLAVMASHAFQNFITDDDLRASLLAIRAALVDGGRFAFETRNRMVREWESWNPDNPFEVVDADGTVIRASYETEPIDGDVVTFTETLSSPSWDEPYAVTGRLRFLGVEALNAFLTEAGFNIDAQYGDWTGGPFTPSAGEIITIARRE
ncbi:MAG TPA: methyltransferase domain-containing protein [Micromonosporaceae bacterium]